jgi:hypothetical protein
MDRGDKSEAAVAHWTQLTHSARGAAPGIADAYTQRVGLVEDDVYLPGVNARAKSATPMMINTMAPIPG